MTDNTTNGHGDPTIYKQDDGTLRVDWPGSRPRWVQVAPDVIDGWAETHNALLARAVHAEADAERWREHSVTLNAVGWTMAVALGDASPDATSVVGDPRDQCDRLVGRLAEVIARAERAEADADRLAQALDEYVIDPADPNDLTTAVIESTIALKAHDEAVAQR